MKNDILTLVRELEILRNENLKLKEENSKLKGWSESLRAYKGLMYKSMKLISYVSGSNSKILAERAIGVLKDYDSMRELLNEKPVNMGGYYGMLKKAKAEAEKLSE